MYWKISSLVIFALFCLWVWYESHRTVNVYKARERAFWDREARANSTRRKSLDGLAYITVPTDLPTDLYPDNININSYKEIIAELSRDKIVNFTGFTNTDLKLEYGAPNIGELTRYDQNYTTLITTLQKWADELMELGSPEEAYKIMEYLISVKCDIGKTYRILGRHYLDTGNTDGFDKLVKTIGETRSLNQDYIKGDLLKMKEASD